MGKSVPDRPRPSRCRPSLPRPAADRIRGRPCRAGEEGDPILNDWPATCCIERERWADER
eukprot:3103791-Pyramimonas_sp.AAC.1